MGIEHVPSDSAEVSGLDVRSPELQRRLIELSYALHHEGVYDPNDRTQRNQAMLEWMGNDPDSDESPAGRFRKYAEAHPEIIVDPEHLEDFLYQLDISPDSTIH